MGWLDIGRIVGMLVGLVGCLVDWRDVGWNGEMLGGLMGCWVG